MGKDALTRFSSPITDHRPLITDHRSSDHWNVIRRQMRRIQRAGKGGASAGNVATAGWIRRSSAVNDAGRVLSHPPAPSFTTRPSFFLSSADPFFRHPPTPGHKPGAGLIGGSSGQGRQRPALRISSRPDRFADQVGE